MERDKQKNENKAATTIEVENLETERKDSNRGASPASSEEKTNEYLELLRRVKADFDNYRKRVQAEQSKLFDQVRAEFSKQLLPILDDLERLLESPGEDHQIREGAKIICQNLRDVLTTAGVESFAAVGDTFDPNIHEAIGVEHTTPELEGKIIELWQKGYRFKDKLLRPAKVKVGVKKDENINEKI